MISGVDYKKRTRTRFILYAVFAGPLLGLLIALCILLPWILYERLYGPEVHQQNAFMPFYYMLIGFFPVGAGPALVAGLWIVRRFSRNEGVSDHQVLSGAVRGAVFGNNVGLLAVLLMVSGLGNDLLTVPVLVVILCAPLVLAPISAVLLWRFRPRAWIGPMTKDELAVWRREQDALNQNP